MIDLITDFLTRSQGKLVVFADSSMTLSALRQRFPQAAVFAATTPQAERVAALSRFRADPACRLFLADFRAAATGINLSVASEALFVLDYPHEVAYLMQALGRLHAPMQENEGTNLQIESFDSGDLTEERRSLFGHFAHAGVTTKVLFSVSRKQADAILALLFNLPFDLDSEVLVF